LNDLPKEILWLNDAPLFIDEKQVEAFYDAILQPDFEEISRNLGESLTAQTGIEGGLTLGGVLPWFAKGEGTVKASHQRGRSQERTATWNRVVNPYRHLLALALRYAGEKQLKSRLVLGSKDRCVDAAGNPVDLGDESLLLEGPRPVVMLDLPPGTELIPLALELTNGKVVLLFEELARRFQKPGQQSLPAFAHGPGREAEQAAYWKWFVDAFEKQVALEVVEDAVEDASIAWIDFRFQFRGRFPHLHLSGRGAYETGVFGYQMISRGFEHGIRIVGTLKSEPDINVLAIFER
jgi:hypothetical protein